MTQDLSAPHPEKQTTDKAFLAVEELKSWALLHAYTGTGYIRVNFNQGGVTAARASLEEPLLNH